MKIIAIFIAMVTSTGDIPIASIFEEGGNSPQEYIGKLCACSIIICCSIYTNLAVYHQYFSSHLCHECQGGGIYMIMFRKHNKQHSYCCTEHSEQKYFRLKIMYHEHRQKRACLGQHLWEDRVGSKAKVLGRQRSVYSAELLAYFPFLFIAQDFVQSSIFQERVVEKVVRLQLLRIQEEIIWTFFRSGHSTETALIVLVAESTWK